MELHEANKILRTVKAALSADGVKLPPSAETDGLMLLLDKLDAEKFLAPKIKHAKTLDRGSAAFTRAAACISFFRGLLALKTGISGSVTAMSLMLLHKSLCGDLDEEAGKPRASDLTTSGSAHTDPKYISGSLKSIASKMNDIESAPTISKEDFAGYLSHYMRELVIMHPFERGSEFTVRIFVALFCKLKGFSLYYYRCPPSSIKVAEDEAFATDDITPMYKLFINCLSYERTAVAPPQKQIPRTRREINNRDFRRIPRTGAETAAVKQAEQKPQKQTDGTEAARPAAPDKQSAANKRENRRAEKAEKAEKTGKNGKPQSKPRGKSDDDVLKRAIRLQQKISKLNEQLTELIQPLDKSDN
ncbi:MAG: Fic family protein [Roseburia sp.]|nr:Fic family protein [Roseburia sp.]